MLVMQATQKERRPNRRGQGAQLREEILAAAVAIIDRDGTHETLTLRSIAREAGIAAPSIYAHFTDLDAVLAAVVDRFFDQLRERTFVGEDRPADPTVTLVAGCHAYASFATEYPARYRTLFGTVLLAKADEPDPDELSPGQEAFQLLVDGIAECAGEGRSDSTDPFTDAGYLWAALHGTVTLRVATPKFPWPPLDDTVDALVRRIARLT
jgi:AcrR family transcriptional regulator